jgi:hypothetical protein
MRPTPPFFVYLVVTFLGSNARFAEKLWQHYPASQALGYQLERCKEPAPTLVQRIRKLADLMPGAQLIAASEAVSPANGRTNRLPEAVQFEEAVLQRLDREGRWKW